MKNKHFEDYLHDYSQWRNRLVAAVGQYQDWLDRNNLNDAATHEATSRLLESLQSDRITLAFAAEFSRGKTELINAMFFGGVGVRLLPSTPGRTTMCPSEFFFDKEGGNYIRLLQIESRLDQMSLSDFKKRPQSWMHIELDPSSPTQMQDAFQELVAVKQVSVKEAKKLGLYFEELYQGHKTPDMIEIPCWRHAMISFPHPLLKEGLAILDTPGLNAVGSEPELTLNMLPSAQAVLFVLAADTGVTKSDLDMWRNHVRGDRAKRKSGVIVVLNKIDTLWDDLAGGAGIEESILSQVTATASVLNISPDVIFPVSAKQALLAKVKSNPELLEKSRLHALEEYISNQVLSQRRSLLVQSVNDGVGHLVSDSSAVLYSQINNIQSQLDDMRDLDTANQSTTIKLMAETRREQGRYLASVEKFQNSRKVFSVQTRMLLEALSLKRIDIIIKHSRRSMVGSLTTVGIKKTMRDLYEELRKVLQEVIKLTEDNRRLVRSIYKKFQEQHGFKEIKPKLFSIRKYQLELELLYEEGEAFRDSAASTTLPQGMVVQKTYDTTVSRAHEVMEAAFKDASQWSTLALSPLRRQIKDYKKNIESRLDTLRKVNTSKEDLGTHLKAMEKELAPLLEQQKELDSIMETLQLEPAEEEVKDEANAEA